MNHCRRTIIGVSATLSILATRFDWDGFITSSLNPQGSKVVYFE